MSTFNQLLRLIRINAVFARNGSDQLLRSIRVLAPLRILIYLNPWNWGRKVAVSRGEALRKSLEELGPIFIKFGQALSTRPDLLPVDIACELCKLQDQVPPFPSSQALTIIEQAYGQSALAVFDSFSNEPLASASMAQVHAARLKTGEEVVVKILRPGMRRIIKQDIKILHTIALLVEKYWSEGRRLKPSQVVQEFEQTLLDELNLQKEAANGCQLRRNFTNSPLLFVPQIYWDYTRESVLVMDRIYGIPIADVDRLKAANINIKKLAERGVEIFFTQVFRDCFFHADMHPGNIFVSTDNPEQPQYICIDFGIMGSLCDKDKRYLAENLFAFFNRDYRRVAELHIESGWISRETKVSEFESAIRMVCEPIFEKPLKDISFGQVVLRLFQVARQFNMEVQPQLVLLQKTLLAVEGLGRQLYPELDLWATAKPFLEKWLKEQIGPKALLAQIRENIPFLTEQLPHLPKLFYEVLSLQKQEKIAALIPHEMKQNAQRTVFKSGLGWGVSLASAALTVANYLSQQPSDFLLLGSTIGLFLGFSLVLLNNKRRL